MPFLACNGQTLHYRWTDTGSARTFLFINSLGTDERIWDDVVVQLRAFGNILRFDKRGHGLSDVPVQGCTIADYAADVVALMDILQRDHCVVVGLSIVGMIAQHLTVQHPDRVEKLVLSNTAPKIGTAEAWNERINTIRARGLGYLTDAIVARWFSESFAQAYPVQVAGYRNMLERTPQVGYVRACEALRDADLTDVVSSIDVPTLCLGGTADQATPTALVQGMAALIPGAQCHMIVGAGHLPCLEAPDQVAAHLISFADS